MHTVHEEQSVQYVPGVLSPLPGNKDTRKSLFLAKKHSINTKHVFILFLYILNNKDILICDQAGCFPPFLESLWEVKITNLIM